MKHIKLFEQFVNEANNISLVSYTKDISKKIFAKGGNGQNVLDYTLELAQYLDNTKKPGDDGWYGPMTTGLFQNLVNAMGLDDIEHNNVSGVKSKKKPEIWRGPSNLSAEVESAVKMVKSKGGSTGEWDKAALELADHLQNYMAGASRPSPQEDGFYTNNSLSAFLRLVAEIATENIKNLKVK
jgi:hypothetical protein